MKSVIFNFWLLLFSLSTSVMTSLAGGADVSIWEGFLNNPNKAHYSICLEEVNDSLVGEYEKNSVGEQKNTPTQLNLIGNYELFSRFNALVRGVNPFALDLAFKMRSLTSGAAAEDLYASIGMTVKKEPEEFLLALDKHNVKKSYQIKRLVTALPIDEFVDDTPKRIDEIKDRIRALEIVDAYKLEWYKNQGVAALKKQLRFYQSKAD